MEDKRKKRAERFGALLRTLREQRGWSLREVEEKMHGEISNPYLSQLERGERNVPNLEVVEKLARLYDQPMERFLSEAGFFVGQVKFSNQREKLWERYEKLSPSKQEILEHLLDFLVDQETRK